VLGFEPMTYGSESECATHYTPLHYTTAPHKVRQKLSDVDQSCGVKDAAPLGTSLSPTQSLHRYVAITSARAAAAAAEADVAQTAQRKIRYVEIAQTHPFYLLAFETMGPINVVGRSSSAIWVIESLESLMTREILHFSFNAFQLPLIVLTQSFPQICMTTPQAF